MKLCQSCNQIKPANEFSKSSRSKDGLYGYCKPCDSERCKQYRKKNASKIKERKKEYWKREGHRFLSKFKEYRENNKKSIGDSIKKWAKSHREHLNSYKKEWREKTGKGKIHFQTRRQREKNAGGNGVTAQEWRDLVEKYKHRCLGCKKKKPLTMDHVVPLARGGRHEIQNIQPLCSLCNSVKGVKTIDYRPVD